MWNLYESLLRSSRGRAARILTCGVIGGLLFLSFFFTRDPGSWHEMLLVGAIMGLTAGAILTGLDERRKRIEAALPSPRRRKPANWWVAAVALVVSTVVVIGGVIWTLWKR